MNTPKSKERDSAAPNEVEWGISPAQREHVLEIAQAYGAHPADKEAFLDDFEFAVRAYRVFKARGKRCSTAIMRKNLGAAEKLATKLVRAIVSIDEGSHTLLNEAGGTKAIYSAAVSAQIGIAKALAEANKRPNAGQGRRDERIIFAKMVRAALELHTSVTLTTVGGACFEQLLVEGLELAGQRRYESLHTLMERALRGEPARYGRGIAEIPIN